MKSLVVYFSNYGTTKKFAEEIARQTGSDIKRIEPVNKYDEDTSNYEELAKYAKKEHDENMRPEIKNINDFNIDDYDIIFIGYPMWWYTMPMIIYTFFEHFDFSGKILIPFNTHEGSMDGGTYATIRELEPNAKLLNGLPIRGFDLSKDQSEVIKKWLDNIKELLNE